MILLGSISPGATAKGSRSETGPTLLAGMPGIKTRFFDSRTRVPLVAATDGSIMKETEVMLEGWKPGSAAKRSASLIWMKGLAAVMPVKRSETERYWGWAVAQLAMQTSSETETFSLETPDTTLKTISLEPAERLGRLVVKARMAPPNLSVPGLAKSYWKRV